MKTQGRWAVATSTATHPDPVDKRFTGLEGGGNTDGIFFGHLIKSGKNL